MFGFGQKPAPRANIPQPLFMSIQSNDNELKWHLSRKQPMVKEFTPNVLDQYATSAKYPKHEDKVTIKIEGTEEKGMKV